MGESTREETEHIADYLIFEITGGISRLTSAKWLFDALADHDKKLVMMLKGTYNEWLKEIQDA